MEGTNYIDHRFQYGDMIRCIYVDRGCIRVIDIHGNLLYVIVPLFSTLSNDCTIKV